MHQPSSLLVCQWKQQVWCHIHMTVQKVDWFPGQQPRQMHLTLALHRFPERPTTLSNFFASSRLDCDRACPLPLVTSSRRYWHRCSKALYGSVQIKQSFDIRTGALRLFLKMSSKGASIGLVNLIWLPLAWSTWILLAHDVDLDPLGGQEIY